MNFYMETKPLADGKKREYEDEYILGEPKIYFAYLTVVIPVHRSGQEATQVAN